MSIRWCRSSRIAAPDPLVAIRNSLGLVNNFVSAADPIAKYMEYYARAQRYIDDASTFLSAERLLAETASLGLREQVQDVLTDNGYFIQYTNFRQLVDRFGVGALIDSAEANLDSYESDDLSRIPGVRSTFPPRQEVTGGRAGSLFVNSSGFREIRESKARRAVYSALDLAGGGRFENFESWLIPVLDAFYDVGDDQRPQWGPNDKVGGMIFTVEGSNFLEVQERFKRLHNLFQNLNAPALLPAYNYKDLLDTELVQNLSDIARARDSGKDNGAETLWRTLNLVQTQGLQPLFFEDLATRTFTTSPDFLRAGTADLIPLFGRLYDLLDIVAGLISPTLPFSFSLDKLAQSQVAFLTQIIESLQLTEELLQNLIDIFELAGVSRLYVPLEKRTTNELVQEIYEATPTRNDLVRVYNNDVGAQVGGLPLFPGQLVNQNQADELQRTYPGLQIGSPGNILVAGIGIFYTEGPLARLIETFFAPRDEDFDETDGGTPVLDLPEYVNLVDGLREPLERVDSRGRSTGPSTPPPTGVAPSSQDPFLGPWLSSAGVQDANPRSTSSGTAFDYQQPSTDLATLRPDVAWSYASDSNFVQLDPNERREGWQSRAAMSSVVRTLSVEPEFLNLQRDFNLSSRAPIGEFPRSLDGEPEVDMPAVSYRSTLDDENVSESEPITITIEPGGRYITSSTALSISDILYVRVRFEGRLLPTYVRTRAVTGGTSVRVFPALPAVPVVEEETSWSAYRRTSGSRLREATASIPKTGGADDGTHPGWTVEALCSVRKMEELFSIATESYSSRDIPASRSVSVALQSTRDGIIIDSEASQTGSAGLVSWGVSDPSYLDLKAFTTKSEGVLYAEAFWPSYETRHDGLEGSETFAPEPPEGIRLRAGTEGAGATVQGFQYEESTSSESAPVLPESVEAWQLLRVRSPKFARIGLGTLVNVSSVRTVGVVGRLGDVFVFDGSDWTRVDKASAYSATQDGPEIVITPTAGIVSSHAGSTWVVQYEGNASTDDDVDLVIDARGTPFDALHAQDSVLFLEGGPFSVAEGACPRGTIAAAALASPFHGEIISAPVALPSEDVTQTIPERYIEVVFRVDVDTLEEIGTYRLWETKSHYVTLTINADIEVSLYQKSFDLSAATLLHSDSFRHAPRGASVRVIVGVSQTSAEIETEVTLPDNTTRATASTLVLPSEPRPLEPYPGQAAIRIGEADDFSLPVRDFQSNSWTSDAAIYYGFLASEVESARLISVTP